MHQYRIVWEQEEKNREVEIFVNYRVLYNSVQVLDVRPAKVSLYDRATQKLTREVKVWTQAGRQLLASQYLDASEGICALEETIHNEIAEREGFLSPV